MSDVLPLPRAGAILMAKQIHDAFVTDEHDDLWSICIGYREPTMPVQRHTTDGWVAAIFHRDEGHIRIVGQGERYVMRNGGSLVSCVHRRGVRWDFAEHPP